MVYGTNFVYLPTVKDVTNPDFVHLHAVRYGEIGWGFDDQGWLSFYMTEIVEKKGRIEALFVEKVGNRDDGCLLE
ncbi:hypothetical protein P280DRAFT_465731 [Massarina eburnea CBS 473.64]|uniref:Uncharacterized protein n=1 Tax=Massarina eburnea CBS 473.64 TaxID=1395130 RepID=A0A6A6SHU2_9PLEO|nr:hypothetical protein P280DRAFT_465731 [Massarina eburnea CBS 473.64]